MAKLSWILLVLLLVENPVACTSAAPVATADVAVADSESADALGTDAVDTSGQDGDADAIPAAVGPALPATLTSAIVEAAKAAWGDDPTHGLTLTIDVPGLNRWTQGMGLADADLQIPMQGLDHLRVGSITKAFVAAAILRDIEAGKLELQSSVATVLPELSIDPTITVDMLLGHRSGLFNYSDDGNVLAKTAQPISPHDLYTLATSHPPEFPPGTAYKYSNTNFIVLGMILEKLHNVPLHQWLRQTLWTPLQLHDVWLEGDEDIGLKHVPGYLAGQAPLPFDTSWSWAAGALVANGSDLCTWLRRLYVDGSVVSAKSLQAMTTPSPQSLAADEAYGFATMIEHRSGRTLVGHTGSTMGFNAEVYIDRSSGVCVAVLTDDFFGVRRDIGQAVWKTLLGGL